MPWPRSSLRCSSVVSMLSWSQAACASSSRKLHRLLAGYSPSLLTAVLALRPCPSRHPQRLTAAGGSPEAPWVHLPWPRRCQTALASTVVAPLPRRTLRRNIATATVRPTIHGSEIATGPPRCASWRSCASSLWPTTIPRCCMRIGRISCHSAPSYRPPRAPAVVRNRTSCPRSSSIRRRRFEYSPRLHYSPYCSLRQVSSWPWRSTGRTASGSPSPHFQTRSA
mmetsp:Transcript_1358/g.4705  ORF Transcript_1358/g.4705 Transcript_1358/m.4705 type:complete len:224 (-) Transcript_1358:1855-2526(-)